MHGVAVFRRSTNWLIYLAWPVVACSVDPPDPPGTAAQSETDGETADSETEATTGGDEVTFVVGERFPMCAGIPAFAKEIGSVSWGMKLWLEPAVYDLPDIQFLDPGEQKDPSPLVVDFAVETRTGPKPPPAGRAGEVVVLGDHGAVNGGEIGWVSLLYEEILVFGGDPDAWMFDVVIEDARHDPLDFQFGGEELEDYPRRRIWLRHQSVAGVNFNFFPCSYMSKLPIYSATVKLDEGEVVVRHVSIPLPDDELPQLLAIETFGSFRDVSFQTAEFFDQAAGTGFGPLQSFSVHFPQPIDGLCGLTGKFLGSGADEGEFAEGVYPFDCEYEELERLEVLELVFETESP